MTLDVTELAAGPQTDTPLIELPLRCGCGAREYGRDRQL
jgi:hypothetical protein